MTSLNPRTFHDQVRGGIYLAGLSAWRMLRSRQTIINGLFLVMALLVAYGWSLHATKTSERFVRDVVLPIYVSFLLPVFSLCYASVGIASHRQERTLVYLLATPLARTTIYLAKFVAALGLVLIWNLLGFVAMGRIAGPEGWEACMLLWPAVFWASLAYTCLFHLFSVSLRRATVVAVAYALFLETFLGNMPGIVKRVAISFYTQCLVFDMGREIGLGPAGGHNPALFLPVSGDASRTVLLLLAVVFFLAGLAIFCRREYT